MERRLELLRITYVAFSVLTSHLGLPQRLLPIDAVAITATIIGGYPIFREAYNNLHEHSITMEVAMAMGIIASLLINEYTGAATIAFFTLISEYIEGFTIDRGRTAIESLIRLVPQKATVRRNSKELQVDITEVRTGETLVVKPGEKIPVDGRISKGHAYLNQAPITGESTPVEKETGEEVFAGTINQEGVIEVKAVGIGEDTTLGRIIRLVEEAESSKAPAQRFADRFVSLFVPIVLTIALFVYAVTRNANSAIAVFVVACPCAISLATPIAVIASVGRAAKKGIIIKGGIHLEELAKIDTVVFDKTGTLTLGEPRVSEVKPFLDHEEKEIIFLAATTELHSEHSIAQAIAKKANEYGIEIPEHQECRILPGKGIECTYEDTTILLGNRQLLGEKDIPIPDGVKEYMETREGNGETPMMLAHDDHLCGVITLTDTLREDAEQGINALKSLGITRFVMMTGDNPRTAAQMAWKLGITEVRAEMLPHQKAEEVRKLVSSGRRVLMVGDGVNDAPALAEANVGVAMGVVGTQAAIEASDVALMTDSFSNIAEAVRIGRQTSSTIKQNIFGSLIFNIVGVSLAAFGLLSPSLAAIAHALPDVTLFLNSARLLRET